MGHKVHPYGFRLGVSRTWSAKWYADKEYTALLQEDIAVRQLVEKRLANASVSGVEIERGINHVTVTIHTAKPGIVIGKGGANVEILRSQIGALDLEASLTWCVLTESQVVHHGRGEEQVLVVARVAQTALFGGQQAGEQKAPDAVIEDRLTLRGAGDRKTRIGERPGGEHEDLVAPIVPPVDGGRPSKLKPRAVRLPDGLAVAAIDGEQVSVFTLMVEHQQVARDDR